MHRNRGLTAIEILLVTVCVCVVAVLLAAYRSRQGQEARMVRCLSNLFCVGCMSSGWSGREGRKRKAGDDPTIAPSP